MGRTPLADGAAQPGSIRGKKDAAALRMRQHPDLAAGMARQRDEQQRAVAKKIVRRAESRQRWAVERF